ncbi:MAG: hypothetical protein KAQ90_09875, partial [Melioribacteraceae bacterium]|nr:hypothetical protein [Melioribacteraceae bacterium]
ELTQARRSPITKRIILRMAQFRVGVKATTAQIHQRILLMGDQVEQGITTCKMFQAVVKEPVVNLSCLIRFNGKEIILAPE